MRLNPEFRRNVWVQFTWMKLIAAPLLTLILCYVFLLFFSPHSLQIGAEFIGGNLIIGLWGTRRVADTLAEEVSGGTWESQRMSGLGAWQMTWGKILGGASFVWYWALIALAVVFWSSNRLEGAGAVGRPPLTVAFNFMVGGLTAQAAAFAIALVLLRKAAQFRRLTITLAQTCGFLVYQLVVRSDAAQPTIDQFNGGGGTLTPSLGGAMLDGAAAGGFDLNRAILIVIGSAWTMIGAYRLMRGELQYRSLPWVWTGFLVFVIACGVALPSLQGLSGRLLFPFYAIVLLTYLSFFADYRDPVRYRWALVALRNAKWFEVASAIPWWLISYVFAVVLAIVIALLPSDAAGFASSADPRPVVAMFGMAVQRLPESLLLLMLFVLRDLLVLLWLSCSPWRAKADVAGIIYLLLVYCPLAAILWVSGGQHLLPVVLPIASGAPALDYVPIGIELTFALFLFLARWREITRLKR